MDKKHPLSAYRDAKGLSRQQLAEMLGVDPSTVWRWETRAREMSHAMIRKAVKLSGGSLCPGDLIQTDDLRSSAVATEEADPERVVPE